MISELVADKYYMLKPDNFRIYLNDLRKMFSLIFILIHFISNRDSRFTWNQSENRRHYGLHLIIYNLLLDVG